MRYNHLADLAERPSQRGSFKAILLVDDDRELVQTMQWIFADQNFLVDKAFDGREALLKVKANEYDAIICDMKMPNLNGDEFYLEAVQTRPILAARFVFVTGFSHDPKFESFLKRHKLRYFSKPVRLPQLVECVNQLVS